MANTLTCGSKYEGNFPWSNHNGNIVQRLEQTAVNR